MVRDEDEWRAQNTLTDSYFAYFSSNSLYLGYFGNSYSDNSVNVRLTDASGRKVFQKDGVSMNGVKMLNDDNYNSGYYTLTIFTANGPISIKLIKS